MISKIIDGISMAIDQAFDGKHEIYADTDVIQNLAECSFFIAVLEPEQTQKAPNRYFRTHPIDVHYFPREAGNNAECHKVATRLFEILEYITLPDGDLVRGTEMRYEIQDNVLHFFVNYDVFLIRAEEEEVMEQLEIIANTRE